MFNINAKSHVNNWQFPSDFRNNLYIAAITHEVTSSNLVKLISEALDHKSTRFPNLATGYFITSFLKISRGVRRAKISQGKNFS